MQYDPRRGMDQMTMYRRVVYPTPSKNVQEARLMLPKWEIELKEYMV